jgi:hypothetical protein
MRAFRFSGRQLEVLAERNLELLFSDLGNTALLLLQAPVIAWCMILVWRDVDQATDTLYFVMTLSAVWFGAINACREIVKERAVYLRELRVGLEIGSYILSKLVVLALLGFVQCLVLVVMVNGQVALKGGPFPHFVVLLAASLAGTSLGLALSALSGTPDRAVAGVPILLLPQILFSSVILSDQYASRLTRTLQDFTLTQWSYDAQREVAAVEPHLGTLVVALLVLAGMAVGLAVLAALLLSCNSRRC